MNGAMRSHNAADQYTSADPVARTVATAHTVTGTPYKRYKPRKVRLQVVRRAFEYGAEIHRARPGWDTLCGDSYGLDSY